MRDRGGFELENGARVAEATAELEKAAAGLEGWDSTGDVRWMGYNSPGVPRDRQWWEMQLIVERSENVDDTAEGDIASKPADAD